MTLRAPSLVPWGTRPRWYALALSAVLAGCGARTGLRLPDVALRDALDAPAAPDARDVREPMDLAMDHPDTADAVFPDVCVTQRYELAPRPADILFVLDRSSSMEWGLRGIADAPSRWSILREALAATLPRFQSTTRMGALLFPSGNTNSCSVDVGVNVTPALDNAGTVLALMNRTAPGGLTPTYAGLQGASAFYAGRPPDGRGRSIVLATDGAPNCNEGLNAAVCSCTSGGAPNPPCTSATLCLDDARTVGEVARAAAQGVPVYVIGIVEEGRADLEAVMNAMAVAGGRPNMSGGALRYYSVRRPEDLFNALDTIQRLISACVLYTPPGVVDPERVQITVDGVPVPRDPGRRDGWDWTSMADREVSLFGPACDQLLGRTALVVASVLCEGDR